MLKLIEKIPSWVLWISPFVLMAVAVVFATFKRYEECMLCFFALGIVATCLWLKDDVPMTLKIPSRTLYNQLKHLVDNYTTPGMMIYRTFESVELHEAVWQYEKNDNGKTYEDLVRKIAKENGIEINQPITHTLIDCNDPK